MGEAPRMTGLAESALNAVGTPRVKSDGLPVGAHFHKIRVDGVPQGMIDLADRKIVLVNINGVDMPFYLSTGRGHKYGVLSGKWYPFWGLDPDGWFNKTNEDDINEYYGSRTLRNVAEALDRKFGDARYTPKGKKVAKSYRENPQQFESIRSQVNRDMEKPSYQGRERSDYNEARTDGAAGREAFNERIRRIIREIERKD